MFGTETETETSTTMVRRPSVVVVLEDFEGFSTETTSDLIISCSHYVDTLPIVLVLGVASSSTALVSVLYHLFWYGLYLWQPDSHFCASTNEAINWGMGEQLSWPVIWFVGQHHYKHRWCGRQQVSRVRIFQALSE